MAVTHMTEVPLQHQMLHMIYVAQETAKKHVIFCFGGKEMNSNFKVEVKINNATIHTRVRSLRLVQEQPHYKALPVPI